MAALRRSARLMIEVPGSAPDALASAPGQPDVDGLAPDRYWPTMLVLAVCQMADLVTFHFAVERFGPAGELGPLGLVYRWGGFGAVAVVKICLITGVMAVLVRYPWRRAATPRWIALVVAAIGAFGAFTNVLALGVLN